MKLYLIRHGKTDWNQKGLLQGDFNIPLNQEGRLEILKVREAFKNKKVDLCFSSPLERAYETAKIIFPDLNIIKENAIVERDLGEFEGKKHSEYNVYNFWDCKENCNLFGVEPICSLLKRSDMFLQKLKENYSDKTIAVVSHGALLKALHYSIIGYDENEKFDDFSIKNGEVKEYEI